MLISRTCVLCRNRRHLFCYNRASPVVTEYVSSVAAGKTSSVVTERCLLCKHFTEYLAVNKCSNIKKKCFSKPPQNTNKPINIVIQKKILYPERIVDSR